MEAEPGVFESSGLVFFEEEVSDPCEPVADDEGEEEVGDCEGEEDGSEELEKGEDGSNEV